MHDVVWAVLTLLLPVAAVSGWHARGRRCGTTEQVADGAAKSDYLRGIQHLVNDDSDRAIAAFVRGLDVDDDTVETHLALGNLFRRQGEIDRALRVHQNVVARPNLSVCHRQQARYELAHDYLRAGVLDRAENLFRELIAHDVFVARSMSALVTIYEQERDWMRAIEVTQRLAKVRGYSLRPVIAQYYCELAEQARADGEREQVRHYLKQARQSYKGCVRATLLRAYLAEQDREPRLAIRIYRHVLKQDAAFAGETIEPMRRCFALLQEPRSYALYLQELMTVTNMVQPHVAYARVLHETARTDEAIAHLSRYLKKRANWTGFNELLRLTGECSRGRLSGPLDSLSSALDAIVMHQALYCCGHCGFSGRYLHWQCPSCRQWNSIAPTQDMQPAA